MSSHRVWIAVAILASMPWCGIAFAQAPDHHAVIADVNGTPITADEVDTDAGASLAKLQQQIYDLRRAQIDTLIDQRLIDREAARRGITAASLTDAEITSRIQSATDAEASEFYEANKARLQGAEFPTVKEQIKTYLTSQRLTARKQEFVKSLRDAAKVNVYLAPPPTFRAAVSLNGAPTRGRTDAPVTIVEFADFHCPYCRKVEPIVAQLLSRYGDKVRLVFEDMPLDNLHPNARAASEAAQCAAAQGKFWEFHDKLFANDPDVSQPTLDKFATEVGLDVAVFDQCRQARTFQARVEATGREGLRLGVTGTPTFFVNGRDVTGAQPLDAFVKVIDEELAQPPRPATVAQQR